MPIDRTHHLLTHLALALAGVCLGTAEVSFLPEATLALLPYLALLALSWRGAGRRTLPAWAANVLAIAIVALTAIWVMARLSAGEESWATDVPLPAVLIPFLGPVLMAALLVRLFRPAAPGDFWLLQGLGLLQVALACVLADSTVFALVLLLYLVTALCALAANERCTQALRGRGMTVAPASAERPSMLGFGLRWLAGAAVLAGPLFLLTPRTEESQWDPLRRFGMQPDRAISARTGFSEEIDLTRTGTLENDDSPAFSVQVTDLASRPVRVLPADQRWRGQVLDRYEDGCRWSPGLTWSSGGPRYKVRWHPYDGPEGVLLTFRVPRQAGGLFLADPIGLGPEAGMLPVRSVSGQGRHPPLFYEAGGTVLPSSYLTDAEYRYVQSLPLYPDRERIPAVRVRERYQRSLIVCRVVGLEEWTLELVRRLVREAPDAQLKAALDRCRDLGADIPPIFWEPLARLMNDHLARSGVYTYTLQMRRESLTLDPVMDFLQNVRQGHCERYASALTLMLRAVGIPARIVKGFRGADYLGEGKYQVRNSHAHAWVEALVPGKGTDFDWLVLDPTPETEAPALSALTRLQRNSEVLWRDLILGYSSSDQASLWESLIGQVLAAAPLLAVVAALLAVVWMLSRQRWRRKRAALPTEAGSLYARLCRLLERHAGLRPRPCDTPAELAERATAFLAAHQAPATVRDVPSAVVTTLYRMRYGAQAADEAHLRDLSARVDALAAALRGA
jgi:hypothetical protein